MNEEELKLPVLPDDMRWRISESYDGDVYVSLQRVHRRKVFKDWWGTVKSSSVSVSGGSRQAIISNVRDRARILYKQYEDANVLKITLEDIRKANATAGLS